MSVSKQQSYTDLHERLSVVIKDIGDNEFTLISIFKANEWGMHLSALKYEDAQRLARLLVGIEIQPDGAVWRRGPRPPAMPTDKDGNIIGIAQSSTAHDLLTAALAAMKKETNDER